MIDPEMKKTILEKLYHAHFHQYAGFLDNQLDKIVSGEKNDIFKVIDLLLYDNHIEDRNGVYYITVYGIDFHEESSPTSITSKRKERRIDILKILKESYDKDIHQEVDRAAILDKLGDISREEFSAQIYYLEQRRLIDLTKFLGGNFMARLSAKGYQFLEQKENT